jgi:hypothetical protein
MKDPVQFKVNRVISYGTPYLVVHPATRAKLAVIASCDDGTNHVSVSLDNRTPTWDEMCFIKDLFFDAEEICVQIHPKRSQYVNKHKHCLHMWQVTEGFAEWLERVGG